MPSPPLTLDRRSLLTSLGIAGTASLAGCSATEPAPDRSTTTLSEERTQELAEEYAPTLYFDEAEKWFPTDPRAFESEQDGETVVDGFDALNDYTAASNELASPPEPTLFYHGVSYEDSPLSVVQFWYYSAFDQFTTNFHWHDWEVLHVFVDTDTDEPQLYVASSHSRKVPNNEFLDPDPDAQPRILSELGSHSSALSVNDLADRFQRLSIDGALADITNSAIDTVEDVINLPIAYGLPRDEGSRLPYLVPEYEGAPLYEHDRLPAVERGDLLPDSLTVSSFQELASPPSELPARATGSVFQYAGRDEPNQIDNEASIDAEYDLVSTREIEHITAFTGPQLSFEFAVPQFAEDAFAGHITTTGVPWGQPRYDDPAADISDRNHRATLAERYDAIGAPASASTVVASLSQAVSNDDAPEDEGLTTADLGIEGVALLESDPAAVPTFNGVAVVDDVPTGDHRLTVNGAGVEPHSETVGVEEETETTPAGVEGSIPLVARENATKLEVDPADTDSDLTDLAVEDDFAGRLYDAPLSGPDAVYVHRGGAYTTEVRDSDDEIGAIRINQAATDADERVRLTNPQTGKASLATYLADVAEETSAAVAAVEETADDGDDETNGSGGAGGRNETLEGSENAIRGLRRALDAIADAARRAAERAAAGDRGQADQSLANVEDRLERATTRLAEASDSLPNEIERASERRLAQSQRRSEQAQAADKL
ncbi:hypothetical protein DM826_00270 [Halonotius aquaticus]|uniref:Uncharacterized protein n=1 Tax=Halonotius aquaticus TaxID=2216978 RepID=A0A3A6PS13_9EURY|nr:hypothetical protein [Halonotius aquaticus]RJX45169.1 hypothetical protein DM826_00270 [Halonotius aquaticus]